jgi:NADH pyrophosphatase NudC (nudix superfamily)
MNNKKVKCEIGFINNPLKREYKREDEEFLKENFKNSKFIIFKDLNPLFSLEQKQIIFTEYEETFEKLPFAYLGMKDDLLYFCVDVSSVDTSKYLESDKFCFKDCFRVSMFLQQEETAIFSESRTVLDWINNTIFCSKCGTKLLQSYDGFKKFCKTDKCIYSRLYPRINPVVIMLVYNKDNTKILLGKNKKYKNIGNIYSCLRYYFFS